MPAVDNYWTTLIPACGIAFCLSVVLALLVQYLVLGMDDERVKSQVWLSLYIAAVVACITPAVVALMRGLLFTSTEEVVIGLLLAGGIPLAAFGARKWRRSDLLRRTPVSLLRSISVGRSRVVGVGEAACGLVYSRTGGIPALFYTESTEQYQRHHETYYDADEKRNKTRIVDKWVVIGTASDRVDFQLRDQTGAAVVRAGDAEFVCASAAGFYNGFPGDRPWFPAIGDTSTTVRYVPPDAQLMVWGFWNGHEIVRDRVEVGLIVSAAGEGAVLSAQSWTAFACALLGTLCALAGLWLVLQSSPSRGLVGADGGGDYPSSSNPQWDPNIRFDEPPSGTPQNSTRSWP